MRIAMSRALAGCAAAVVVGGGLVAGAGAASSPSALPGQVLDQLVVAPEYAAQPYDRAAFQHWIDADGDGCDTRAEVLIAESQTPATVGPDCTVSGTWTSFLDGVQWSDPSALDVDHLVALEEAWSSGASAWSPAQRRDFANDLDYAWTLNAVTDTVNQSKGSRDPAEWMPPSASAACTYVQAWIGVKYRWHLSVDQAEKSALVQDTQACGSSPMDVPPRADVPDPTTSPADSDHMTGGQTLTGGQWLMSADRTHGLAFQADGNLVAYGPNSRALWSSRTYGNPGATLRMQADGNLVVYAASGAVLWHAGTYGNPGATLTVQDDGNVVLYRSNGTAAWFTGWDRTGISSGQYLSTGQQITSANGRYHLILQPDGNIVVYTAAGRPLFFTGSYGTTVVSLQADGNLVGYRGNGSVSWNSGTWREGGSRLAVQDDGNVVLYRADGTPSWYSGWDAGQTASAPGNGTYVPRPTAPQQPAPQPPAPQPTPPGNPGDTKNCTDFSTWRAAQNWFDTYYPYYGDVAKLDQDNDRIACESLPGAS
jgi:hypothetical protein